MRLHHIVVVCASLLLSSVSARAQAPADPTGHWEGSLDAHGTDVAFQVDFAKNPAGGFIGSISIPGQRLKGLPLTKIDLDGRTITFGARSDQLMIATISPDNASMTGDFSSSAFTGAFVLTRAGGPQVASAPRSAAIGKELEGRWTGVLDVDGGLHLVLTLANQADGTSIASRRGRRHDSADRHGRRPAGDADDDHDRRPFRRHAARHRHRTRGNVYPGRAFGAADVQAATVNGERWAMIGAHENSEVRRIVVIDSCLRARRRRHRPGCPSPRTGHRRRLGVSGHNEPAARRGVAG